MNNHWNFGFEATGTHWEIDIRNHNNATDPSWQRDIQHKVQSRIQEFDRNYSRFRSDSLVTQISKQAGIHHLPPDASPLLSLYWDLYQTTGGMFTPLIGQGLVDIGYDANYSFKPKQLRTIPNWENVMTYSRLTLTTNQLVQLDFGAAGKGYLIDLIGQLLQENNIHDYTVDAGGDIRNQQPQQAAPLRIGLEDPRDPKRVLGIAHLANQSICGSSGNRRAWSNYHHILNPKTLASAQNILAVWVFAQSTLLADAIATCLFFTEPSVLLQKHQFEYVIVHPDMSVRSSPLAPIELFR